VQPLYATLNAAIRCHTFWADSQPNRDADCREGTARRRRI